MLIKMTAGYCSLACVNWIIRIFMDMGKEHSQITTCESMLLVQVFLRTVSNMYQKP